MNKILKLGYGAGAIADYGWHLSGEQPWAEQDEERATLCLQRLKELGIQIIDTAHRYGNGESERLIGKVFKGNEDIYIFSKIELSTNAEMHSHLIASEGRLGNVPDALMLHNPNLGIDLNYACDWLTATCVPLIGFSTEPDRSVQNYYNSHPFSIIEFPYSMWDRRAEGELFPWLKKRTNLVRVANRILGGPRRTGKLNSEEIHKAIKFIHDHVDVIDIALIGTTSLAHLRECVQIVRELNGESSVCHA